MQSMNQRRMSFGMVVVGNTLFAFGGIEDVEGEFLCSVESFDIEKNRWKFESKLKMNTCKSEFSTSLLVS